MIENSNFLLGIFRMFGNLSDYLKLGILYKNGKVVNHRSLLKVIMNPILRFFGICIGTKFNGNKIGNITLFRCKRTKIIKYYRNSHNEFDFIERVRLWI